MICPQCNADLPYSPEDLADGEIILCDECEEELEVVHLNGGGIALDLAEDFGLEHLDDDIEW